jgi:Inosine-uridine nucleoside N-ribohydrolase
MKPIIIHQTDLFHFHNDPDDHFDLACQYALAFADYTDLKGILVDYPPVWFGDPAIQSINQMNYITGLSMPVAVGTSEPYNPENLTLSSGTNMLINTLENSPQPIHIHIVGSCRDVAIASKLKPDLFREKCGAIYLNAGSSAPDSIPEYNVSVDPISYSAIFEIDCPIYWMPCFEYAPSNEVPFRMGEYGTYYYFNQSEILPYLSERVQKMFLYALSKSPDVNWLSYLNKPIDNAMFEKFRADNRSMYCTGGFFHSAGLYITKDGDITESCDNPIIDFIPVELKCDDKGYVEWSITDKQTNRYIYKVNDLELYKSAMTKAMKTLLCKLPL